MIQRFIEAIEAFDKERENLLSGFREKHPRDYKEIVSIVAKALAKHCDNLNAKIIHEIDDGSYQGNLLYLIPENDSEPQSYYYVMVAYGTCSQCDTLECIRNDIDEKPTESQAKDYFTLALHIVQELKELDGEVVKG